MGLLKARYTLLPWSTVSIEPRLDLSGKQSATVQLMRENPSCANVYHCLYVGSIHTDE